MQPQWLLLCVAARSSRVAFKFLHKQAQQQGSAVQYLQGFPYQHMPVLPEQKFCHHLLCGVGVHWLGSM
jgi:hypothetical protein